MNKKYGRATAIEWVEWLKSELTPPLTEFAAKPQVKYILESMLEMAKELTKAGEK